MRRLTFILLCCVALMCACARPVTQTSNDTANTSATAPPVEKPTPTQIVHADAEPITIKAGGQGEASVRLRIEEGYHINANPATFSYLKATALEVAPLNGLTAGKPAYPAPLMKKFQFAPQPLAVYEHEALIKLPLRAAANAAKGAQTISAQVHVQACDEEKCFPPTTIKTDIHVTIN